LKYDLAKRKDVKIHRECAYWNVLISTSSSELGQFSQFEPHKPGHFEGNTITENGDDVCIKPTQSKLQKWVSLVDKVKFIPGRL